MNREHRRGTHPSAPLSFQGRRPGGGPQQGGSTRDGQGVDRAWTGHPATKHFRLGACRSNIDFQNPAPPSHTLSLSRFRPFALSRSPSSGRFLTSSYVPAGGAASRVTGRGTGEEQAAQARETGMQKSGRSRLRNAPVEEVNGFPLGRQPGGLTGNAGLIGVILADIAPGSREEKGRPGGAARREESAPPVANNGLGWLGKWPGRPCQAVHK
jgi:hypothetical protein